MKKPPNLIKMMKTPNNPLRCFVLLTVLWPGLLMAQSGGTSRPAIHLESMLLDMIDRDAVARWPAPSYTCQQASSWDRVQKNAG